MVSGVITNHSPVTLADATPIARLTGEFEMIVVPAAQPVSHRMRELWTPSSKTPAAIAWGGGSAGGTDDLLVAAPRRAGGPGAASTVNYIAFAGGGEALAAVLGGQVTAGVSGYARVRRTD